MIDTLAAHASRPYGAHAAPRADVRPVIPAEYRGRGRHRKQRPANPTELREPLAVSTPLLVLLVILIALVVTIWAALAFSGSINAYFDGTEHVPTIAEYEAQQ